MFKNKHVVSALIVMPILAILGYFATDYFVSERPKKAQAGGQYQLAQLPNCRYASGKCELKNGNFKIKITGTASENGDLFLQIASEFALDEAYVSVVKDPSDEASPIAMQSYSEDKKTWQINIPATNPTEQYLRVVVATDGAVYYAETTMAFLNYETSFHKDFRPSYSDRP